MRKAISTFLCAAMLLCSGCWGRSGSGGPLDAGSGGSSSFAGTGGSHAFTDAGTLDAANDASVGARVRIESVSFAGSEPDYVIRGDGARVQVWSSGTYASQALYSTSDGSVRTRVFFDDSTGDLTRIVDEVSGKYLIVNEVQGRIEFLEYDSSDQYLRGFALLQTGATFQRGTISGRPVITGQLQGQLQGDPDTGSFALIAQSDVQLQDVQDVTTEMNAFLQASSGAAALGTFGGIGVSTAPLINISRALRLGGLVVAGVGIVGGLPAYGAAGVAMVLSGYFANDIANFIDSKFASDDPFAQEMVDLAVSNLRDPSSVGLGELFQKAIDKAKAVVGGGGDGSDTDPDEIDLENVSSYSGATDTEVPASTLRVPRSGPPAVAADVEGQAVFQDQQSYDLSGTIGVDGTVDVQGTGMAAGSATPLMITIDGQLDVDETAAGSFTRDIGGGVGYTTSGTFTGTVTAVGECEAVQQSGGQGTFTNAHFVGSGGGTVSFSYDAYSIPDAFTVSVGGAQVFTTGGLVSNGTTVDIAVEEDGFVFVSVSAPDASTSWEYSLSCL